MSEEKIEGKERTCGKCKTALICVKVISEYQNKKTEKLQWQNKEDGKPHFYYAGPNNYKCSPPGAPTKEEPKQEPKEEPKPETIKVKGPFDEAELIARWAGERAYKIVMKDVSDYSTLTQQEKSGLGQKEGMYTRLLADTVLELMKQHGIKTEYEK